MRTSKILLGILVVLPATVLLSGQANAGEPTSNECRLKPGSPGPQGTHWYYRIDHTNNRHCWYLGSERQVVSHAHEAVLRATSPSPAPRREDAAETTDAAPSRAVHSATEPAQAASVHGASAAIAFVAPTIQQQSPDMDFAARWPDLPKSVDLTSYGGKSADPSSYADKDAATEVAEQMPLRWPVVAPQHAELQRSATGRSAFGSVSLAAALVMVSLLLGGGVLRFSRHPRQAHVRDQRPADAEWPSWLRHSRAERIEATGTKSAVAGRHNKSIMRVSMPTDPARDLKTSLRELMGDLERAGAARDPDRSFAPAARQMQMATTHPESSIVSRFAVRKRSAFQTIQPSPLRSEKFA